MKQGWEIKKMGDVCQFENGDRGVNYPSKTHRTEVGIPFINAGHLTSEGLDVDNMDYISRERFNLLGSGKVQKGDILFCLRGSLGKFARVQEFSEGAIASSLVIVRPKSKVIPEFLMLYFQSKICADWIVHFSNGAAQPNLSAGNLKNFEIPLPPISEQQRIITILDEAFTAITQAKVNAEQNVKNAQELFESYLQGVFENKGVGWEEKTLGTIAVIKGGKRVPKGYKLEFEKTNHPYIRVADFNDYGSINLDDIRYVNESVFKQIKNYTISKDDLYLSIAGTIGKTGIVPNQLDGANLTENACKLVFKEGVNKKFVYYFTKTNSFEMQAGLNTRTAAMPKLALTRLATIKFYIPNSITTQNDFVRKFEDLSIETQKLKAIYQAIINNLEELKKSIIQKALSGELTKIEVFA